MAALINDIQSSVQTAFPPESAKQRVSQFMKSLQDEICHGLEELDGVGKFREDSWEREEGGGGRSRVMQNGNVYRAEHLEYNRIENDCIVLPTPTVSTTKGAVRNRYLGSSIVIYIEILFINNIKISQNQKIDRQIFIK